MRKHKIAVLTVFIVLATVFIFSNSFKNIEQSNSDSGMIAELVEPILSLITDSEAQASFIIRKGAHLTEFFILGLLVMSAAAEIKKRFYSVTGFSFFYVLSVAVTDEFIQSFSDRTSSVRDVIIDFTGAVLGFVAFTVLSCCITEIRKRKKAAKDVR